jgi:phosphoglycerate kinase
MIKDNPPKPFALVIGGVKITDKIGALENLLPLEYTFNIP